MGAKWWRWLQGGWAVLPFSPLLGALATITSAVLLRRSAQIKLWRQPLNQAWLAVALGMLVSTMLAARPGDAALGLFNFLPFFAIFAVLSQGLRSPQHLRSLAQSAVWTSLPVVGIGFAQLLGYGFELHWGLLDWSVPPYGNPPDRMSSIYFYATWLASYLVVTFTLSVGLALEQWRSRKPSRKPQARALGYSLCAGLNLVALVLTNSRNAWAIAVLVLLAYALYLRWRWLVAGVSALAIAVLTAAYAPSHLSLWARRIVPAYFWARLSDELYPDRPLAGLRSTQWKFAWDLAAQHPLQGWGLRSFSSLYQTATGFPIGHPHNLYLMLAAEVGWPVLLGMLVCVGWIVLQAVSLRWQPVWQTWTRGDRLIYFTVLLGFGCCALFGLFDVPLFDLRINLLAWVLLAGLWGVNVAARQSVGASGSRDIQLGYQGRAEQSG
jgi:O-antigen ligase